VCCTGIDFSMERGRRSTTLLGANGAGKTTTAARAAAA
jgi:ABC-type multidrug transport system ATPase subunit